MSSVSFVERVRVSSAGGEIRKLPAFIRRDFLVAWSYKFALVSDWLGLLVQTIFLYFIGKMVDPKVLPSFGGTRATYIEFVAVGIALAAFIQLGLEQVSNGVRQEQLMGTLESLLMTPTAAATIQLGSVVYQLLYIPVRTGLFLLLVAVGFGLQFRVAGIPEAAAILITFIPFVWGLGLVSAAATLTFRRGSGVIGLGAALLTAGSGAYFPLELLPSWLASVAERNPIAIAVTGTRRALIGGGGWAHAAHDLLVLVPVGAAMLILGVLAFRLALGRERRRGTLGLY
jgi:ABC-2 type transport system permease protein